VESGSIGSSWNILLKLLLSVNLFFFLLFFLAKSHQKEISKIVDEKTMK
jgi:hypothetical protein